MHWVVWLTLVVYWQHLMFGCLDVQLSLQIPQTKKAKREATNQNHHLHTQHYTVQATPPLDSKSFSVLNLTSKYFRSV